MLAYVPTRLVFVSLAVVLLTTCASPAPSPTAVPAPTSTPSLAPTLMPTSSAYSPTQGWRTSTPEQQGIDSEQLVKLMDYVQNPGYDLHSLLIVRNGYLVMEAYWHPFQPDTKHNLQSCTKSFTSALVGIAIDQGYMDGIYHKVLDWFPERTPANNDARKRTITLEHLLTMSSGLDWPTHDLGEALLPQLAQSKDWVQFVLDRPMAQEPGTVFNYNSGGSHLLSAIINKTTRMSALDFARKNLFAPLGITDAFWSSDPNGINTGGYGLELTPRDMAKFGYLYLKNGVWDGQSVVSAAWVKASTVSHIDTGYMGFQYGYQWWLRPSGAYHARGYGGQYIFVLPKQEMVVVFTSGLGGSDMETVPEKLLESFLLPAVKSSQALPENPQAAAKLQSQIQAIAQPQPRPVPPLPEMAASVSGKTYHVQANSFGLESFALSFSNENAALQVSVGGRSQQWAVGLDNVYRTTRAVEPLHGVIALRGSWTNETTFTLAMLPNGAVYKLEFHFDERQETVVIESRRLDNELEVIPGTLP
jgi:CubicO group peptidase (beta-lactamase class C family)